MGSLLAVRGTSDSSSSALPDDDDLARGFVYQRSARVSEVMMGEAISVSELNTFIKEKKKDLSCGSK